ncbi:TPA: BNR-4 repeat-containing protein [Klebsiella michiganensis]
MSNLPETPSWESGIHQLEESDRAKAGPGGVLNIPPLQLANRTRYLKEQLDAYNGLLKAGELPFSNAAVAKEAIDSGKVPDGAIFSIRSEDPYLWVEEFKNVSGEIVATGKKLASSLSVAPLVRITDSDPDGTNSGKGITVEGQLFGVIQPEGSELSLIYYLNNNNEALPQPGLVSINAVNPLKNNDGPVDITDELDYIDKYVIYADGTVDTNGGGWRGLFVNVRKGEHYTYKGSMGSVIPGDNIAVMWQLDSAGNKVAPLVSMVSTGVVQADQEYSATATMDGLIYIRARSRDASGELTPFSVISNRPYYVPGKYFDRISGEASVTLGQITEGKFFRELGAEAAYYGNTFMYVDGSINSATTSWRSYKIPVKKGQSLMYDGPYGSNVVGFIVGLAIQLDSAGSFASVLHPVFGTGKVTRRDGVIFTAEQDGFIWINARTAYSTDITIYREEQQSWIENIAAGETTDYERIDNTVIEGTSITKTPASGEQHAVYLKVDPGDTVTYFGSHGSRTAGQVIDMIIQLDEDKNVVEVLATHTSRGTPDFYTYTSAVAKQAGYLYVRARYSDYKIFARHRAFATAEALTETNQKADTVPQVSCQMERLPIKLDNTWNYNATAFIQDQIVEAGGYQYVVVTAEGRLPHILQRSVMGGPWSVFDLSTVPDLNPGAEGSVLKSPTKEDGHCVAVMGITKNGYILVAANHHGDPWRCVISENPHDISAWKRAPYATDSKVVTYPRFVSYPDGTLQAFWREGSSGNGVYYGATFNDETMLFNPKVLLIDAQASNPYEQRIVVDDAGTLHLCWGYRTDSQNADTNFGLFYAKSTDKGATFTSADGSQQYALPLSGSNAEKIIDAPAGSGYCNQNGACHDLENNYHTVIWQYDRDGATQICHIWFDGTQWQQELVSRFNFAVALNVPTLDGALCRPLIFCTNLGRLYAAYHMTEMGRRNDIRVIDVTEPGAPVDYCVAKYDVGTIELAINTDMVKRGGDLCMLATRGASGVERPGYKQFVAESVYLLTAALPMKM